jgi:hypothetical protein
VDVDVDVGVGVGVGDDRGCERTDGLEKGTGREGWAHVIVSCGWLEEVL